MTIGASIDLAATDAPARQDNGVGMGVMVPSSAAIDFRCASKVAQCHHQSFLQAPALGKVVKECGNAFIKGGQHRVLEPVEIVSMGIPMVTRGPV